MIKSSARVAIFPLTLLLSALLFFSLSLIAFSSGGVTWDEVLDFEGVNGAYWHGINFLKGLNPDLSGITFDLEYFGNSTRWPTYFVWRLLNTTAWESYSGISRAAAVVSGSYVGLNHLNATLFGFIGVCLTGYIGKYLGGPRLAVLSTLFIVCLPTWLGHSWMNSKDIPFAASYLLYTYGSIMILDRRVFKGALNQDLKSFVFRSVGIGLLLGARVGSAPFILISEFAYLLILRKHYFPTSFHVLLGGMFGFVLTPQAWGDPLGYPFEAINFIANRQGAPSGFHTLSYISFHLLETLPFFLSFGLITLFVFRLKTPTPSLKYYCLWLPVVLQLCIAPLLLIAGSRSIYNELRHILFIYPSICIVSAHGWLECLKYLSSKRLLLTIIRALLISSIAIAFVESAILSPYQYLYRSDLARLLTPDAVMHRDYWGFSVRQTTATCFKDKSCSSLMSSVPYELRHGDWNADLFSGLRELLQTVDVISASSSESKLQLQISPYKDSCSTLVETSRWVVFPSPHKNIISRIARCP